MHLSIYSTRCSSSVCCQYTGRGHYILPTYFVLQKPSFSYEQWLIEKETECGWLNVTKRWVFRLRVLYTIKAYIWLQNWKRKLMILKISPRSGYFSRENPIQRIHRMHALNIFKPSLSISLKYKRTNIKPDHMIMIFILVPKSPIQTGFDDVKKNKDKKSHVWATLRTRCCCESKPTWWPHYVCKIFG
jgi:hypothetical protein